MQLDELASQLDVSPKALRAWLTKTFAGNPSDQRTHWHLTERQIRFAREYWRPKDRSKSTALRSRKHGWVEDEIILALELFMREGVNASAESVNRLSETLRSLPIERELAEDPAFRSPASVRFKLGNFQSIASDGSSGFSNASVLDREIWFAYMDDRESLERDAYAILENADQVGLIGPLDDDEEPPVEGRVVAALHKRRERDSRLRKRKIESATVVACEACGFDFGEVYGERGSGFIECHHLVPLAELCASGRKTSLDDLALLCSNCHRMIHRSRPWLSLPELVAVIDHNRHS